MQTRTCSSGSFAVLLHSVEWGPHFPPPSFPSFTSLHAKRNEIKGNFLIVSLAMILTCLSLHEKSAPRIVAAVRMHFKTVYDTTNQHCPWGRKDALCQDGERMNLACRLLNATKQPTKPVQMGTHREQQGYGRD